MYKGTAAEAREKGEFDLWRESHRETQRCRDAIDQTIREHFDGWYLEHDIHLPVIEEFGIERVNTVIASTLAHKDYDGRFSHHNRDWASGLDVTTDDRYVSEAHPAVLDGFIDMVRKYNEQGITETAGEGTDEAPADIPDEDSEGIKRITTDDLRHMKGSEGLILQGCGGSLQEWVDGINQELTDEGILLDGTKFSDVSVFKNDNVTCLYFPFSDDVKLNMGKFAMWRLVTHEAFGGTWLSDYVPNRLGGFSGEEPAYEENPDYDGDPDEDGSIVMQ